MEFFGTKSLKTCFFYTANPACRDLEILTLILMGKADGKLNFLGGGFNGRAEQFSLSRKFHFLLYLDIFIWHQKGKIETIESTRTSFLIVLLELSRGKIFQRSLKTYRDTLNVKICEELCTILQRSLLLLCYGEQTKDFEDLLKIFVNIFKDFSAICKD